MAENPFAGGSPETDPPEEKNEPVIVGAHSTAALKVGDLDEKKVGRHSFFRQFIDAFLPNRVISRPVVAIIIAFQVGLFFLLWSSAPAILPRPAEVFAALGQLWQQGLGQDMLSSMKLNLAALAWTAGISLVLSYLTVLPFMRPLVVAISKGRFLSLVGFSLIFTLITGGGPALKLGLLVFGMTVFFITSMASVVAEIPKEDFDHARTLRMSEWRVVWEVVVLGTFDKAWEVLRQNAAIGWMMLTMVESVARAEGGIGVALLNQQKYFKLGEVFAIQFLILFIGLFQDYILAVLRRLLCPYSVLTLERKGG